MAGWNSLARFKARDGRGFLPRPKSGPLDSCLFKELGVATACEIRAQFFEVSDRLAQIIAAKPSRSGRQLPGRYFHEIQESPDRPGLTSNQLLVGNREDGMLRKEFYKFQLSTSDRFKVSLTFVRIELHARRLGDYLTRDGHCDVSEIVRDVVRKITTK